MRGIAFNRIPAQSLHGISGSGGSDKCIPEIVIFQVTSVKCTSGRPIVVIEGVFKPRRKRRATRLGQGGARNNHSPEGGYTNSLPRALSCYCRLGESWRGRPEQGVNSWMWNYVPKIVTGRGMSRTPAQEPSRASWLSGWARRFQDTAREVRDLDRYGGRL